MTRPTATELTGTATLTRLVLRRDRVRILVWTVAVPLLVILTAASVKGLYPTQADLDEAAATSADNAAAIAFNGPVQALDTLGGQVAFQTGSLGLVVVALMSMFMVGRQTRAEEEAGRTELIRSMAVGRHAPTAAALLVVAGMNVVVGALVTLGLVVLDLPVVGSVVFGVSFCALGIVFAAITTVAAQITENTRVVHGGTGAVLGLAFVLRAVGDIGDGTVSWFSPIGWVQKNRPFAGERWWPLLVAAACTIALIAVADALADRRDIGAGLVAPRPGPRSAAPGLGRPLGLAFRLQRGSLIGWSTGVFLTGVAYGWVADDVEEFIGDNEAIRDVIAQYGEVSLTDSYLARSLLTMALIATGYAIQSAVRLRGEEAGLRAEPLLATPVSRHQWAASHLAVALAGSVIVLAAGGLGTGLAYGIVGHDLGQVPRLLGAALVYTPALWLLVGLATVLFGLVPRGVVAAWAALAFCLVIGVLGEVLDVPAWVGDLSPFQHTPLLPADDLAIAPLALLAVIAVALTAIGMLGFRRRDLGGAAAP
ncbi:ABC transporter permease [Streptomyces aurantiogriseus]|uniref:Tetronasin ABC transporter integral membrane protein n=1 Tax=Streptomyces aurantiogriseus TaxID=66870 RepID=A0A918FFS9_9ACTN|nr:ABC transporter permease [Streptomyces aurantiogriseus]GGR35253.1 tetronasin ABC transporter integral membrane protein [Streptomyces aurantiogriseus]